MKGHLNKLRKRLTDEADSGPPEETVMDVICNTSNIPTPLAAPEMRRSKRKSKVTDLIVVNPKRIRYWDQKQIKISQSLSTWNSVKQVSQVLNLLPVVKKETPVPL